MYPYFIIKRFIRCYFIFNFFQVFLCFLLQNFLGHSDNYIPANPLVTPPHIVPEWYFLPFYAILRSIPSKLGGVVALLAAILTLILLPFIVKAEIRSSDFRPLMRLIFFMFVIVTFILGWLGSKPIALSLFNYRSNSNLFIFSNIN